MGITVSVTRVACNTVAGNQSISTEDLGGLTPKAAWLIVTEAITDGTAAAHAVLGIGAVTGATNRWAVSISAEDAAATSDTYRIAMSDQCIAILNPADGTVDGEADFVSFNANGMTINWGNAPAAAYLLTIIFFAGTDLSAHANTFTMAVNANDVVDVTDPGFEPDVLLTASPLGSFDDTTFSTALYSLGLVLNKSPIEQYAIAMRHTDAAAAAAVASHLTDNYGVAVIDTSGTITKGGEFGGFDANGFSCTTRLDTIDAAVGYLALAFGGAASFEGNIITTPTATGNQGVTDPGFAPQAVILGLTQMPAIDTGYADGSAGSVGMAAFDFDEAYCNSISDEDAADPTDTQSLSDNTAVNVPLHDGTAGHVAAFVSFDANGWTWNFTTTQDPGVKYWYLAIQQMSATTSTSSSTSTTTTSTSTTTTSTSTTSISTSTSSTSVSTTTTSLSTSTTTTSLSTTTSSSTSTTTTSLSTSTSLTTSTSTTTTSLSTSTSLTTSTSITISTSTTTTLAPVLAPSTAVPEPRGLMYIEQVRYIEPHTLNLIGGDDDRLRTFMSQQGIKSTDTLKEEFRSEFHPVDHPIHSPYPPSFGGVDMCSYGLVPLGGIILWSGAAAIPDGYALCNGSNGTPDLRDRFVMGAGGTYAVGDTGGSATMDWTHTHGPGTLGTDTEAAHTHGAGTFATDIEAAHTHAAGTYSASSGIDNNVMDNSGAAAVPVAGHTHDVSGISDSGGSHAHDVTGTSGTGGSHSHAVNSGVTASGGQVAQILNPYYALCYIQRIKTCTTSTSTTVSTSTSTSSSTSTTTTLAP